MTLQHTVRRPLICLSCLSRVRCLASRPSRAIASLSSESLRTAEPPPWKTTRIPKPEARAPQKRIKIYPPPPSARSKCPFPVQAVDETNLNVLDPKSSRRGFFDRNNKDKPRIGDIILTTFHHDHPFAGFCLAIRRRGVDTSILLRDKVGLVGAEMWIKVFSPNVKGIEVVKRAGKKPKRRKSWRYGQRVDKLGNVTSIVREYLRMRRLIRSGPAGMRRLGVINRGLGGARQGGRAR
ncbi:MAG: hypothetical protein Q9191_003132 [Dirinaria sp. TL-2023a]